MNILLCNYAFIVQKNFKFIPVEFRIDLILESWCH